jgi:hypothetical protein
VGEPRVDGRRSGDSQLSLAKFQPWEPLIEGQAEPGCRSVVIVPARNEEGFLGAALDALGSQVDLDGKPLDRRSFEVLLLLNNCTDGTAKVAAEWKRHHPEVTLNIAERTLSPGRAFVGTARRLLMDTAWNRLIGRSGTRGILSTDSDSLVSADWVAQNMAALAGGADAVGGVIALNHRELQMLPSAVRTAYLRDKRYQRLVAQLEDYLDPQEGDPWPRHLEHFGASLACTPEAYALAGGLPPVNPLEDVAFVGALRRAGARLRHHPGVKVFTSARMHGRVRVGLSGQLKLWEKMSQRGEQHSVQSAAWLAHRFRTLGQLRKEAAVKGRRAADHLAEVDCDRIVAETFRGKPEGEIRHVIRSLSAMLAAQSSRSWPATSLASRTPLEQVEPIALM